MGYIETYGHGGDLQTAAAVFAKDPSSLLDFSANINPLGPPPGVMTVLQKELHNIVHYPDPGHRTFRAAVAAELNVDQESILVGNGAAECMALALQGLAPQTLGVAYPCFSEYTQLAHQYGIGVQACFGDEQAAFQPLWPQLEQLIRTVDMVILGHPNNPTGVSYQKQQLLKLAECAEAYGTYLVFDEAFIDFIPPDQQNTLLPELAQFPHLLLIRSMTKFYAIPGLRLGFTVAAPQLIQKLRDKQITWSVNHLALAAGVACLQETEYAQQTRQLIQQERTFLIQEIERQLGWQVWHGEANFLLVRSPQTLPAKELQHRMGQKGILIRDCSMYPGLTPHHFRIAVKNRVDNEKLLAVLKQVAVDQPRR